MRDITKRSCRNASGGVVIPRAVYMCVVVVKKYYYIENRVVI